jgi:predicted ATPase
MLCARARGHRGSRAQGFRRSEQPVSVVVLADMRFVTGVRVTDFRSIAQVDLRDIGDIVPIVGLNGSGKSNLLRALSLFFTGDVEQGDPVDLRRDFREPGRKQKLRISVEVDLDFGVFRTLRSEYVSAIDELAGGSPEITVRKEWTVEPTISVSTGAIGEELTPVPLDRLFLVPRLLGAVRFRYLPNHIHPSRILGDEEREIRRMLFDRLGKRQVLQDQSVASIGEVAAELMEPVADLMGRATGEVAAVELATPADWRDLAWTFGMKMRGTQTQSFDALLHGSGVQSVLAYAILHAIDTSFSGTFGWRKGAVWAVEEPESFLHAGLQQELTRLLTSYAEQDSLQILLTTHGIPFLGAASHGLLTSLDPAGRTEIAMVERSELLRQAFSARIAPYGHALHTGPPKPVLLVEGTNDKHLLLRAFREGNVPNPYDVRSLEDFDPALQGGDEVSRWLKYNAPALGARPETSPVYVLRDWETNQGTVNSINAALAPHATSRCLVWPKDLTNADLSDSFVGIEKFLSTEFMEHAAAELGLALTAAVGTQPWRYDMNRQNWAAAKSAIHGELERRADPADIAYLIAALAWLCSQVTAAPQLA